jgi:hypothetical protein
LKSKTKKLDSELTKCVKEKEVLSDELERMREVYKEKLRAI